MEYFFFTCAVRMCSYKYFIDDWIIGKVFAYQFEEGFIC